jgi:PAS domain S-box-containing protein
MMEFWRFKSVSQEYGMPMVGQYDIAIVILSIVIACLACYAALTIAYRIISWQTNIIRWIWLVTGASTMGLGIWAMHFTGMLAYSMDSPVHYSVPITVLSALPAILGSGIVLFLLSKETTDLYRTQISAFLLATCIATMHYVGMEAMQMDALLYYDFGLFILSFVVAHLLASIAMTIKFINSKRFLLLAKYNTSISAIVMGLAISGMHYTAMASAQFYVSSSSPISTETYIPTFILAASIASIVIVLLSVTIITTNIYQYFENISDRLEESQNELNTFINSAPIMMWMMDENGQPKLFNETWLNFTGKSLSDELAHSWDGNEVHPDDQKACFAVYKNHIKNRTAFDHEFRLRRFDGVYRWVREVGVPFLGARKKYLGFIGNCLDITERKQTEEQLQSIQSYLANIIDSMPSILIGVNADSKVTQWNSQAQKLTGISPEEAHGQNLEKVFPRIFYEMPKVHKAIISRNQQSETKRSYLENGDIKYENITIYPLVTNGVEGAVIRIDDVTEKVHLEEMMIQSEKMLSVGGLAAGMAHEINNPLAGMMQTANVMKNRLTANEIPANLKAAEAVGTNMEAIHDFMTDRGVFRMLDSITDSGKRVAKIVDNILSFARKSDAETLPHDMGELLDYSLELAATDYDLKKQYDFKAIKIIREYAEDLPTVLCEGTKIQQVFMNIVRNGAEAMQEAKTERPQFILRTQHDSDPKRIVIEIEDNGPGINESTRRRIFEPFFTTKPVGVGTGLGLSVSYFIIAENHRGEMSVVSELGKGTRFIIRLPI